MALNLRSTDLPAIADAQRVLLSPLDYPTLDAWRHEVNRITGNLVDADHVTFGLPTTPNVYYSADHNPGFTEQYPIAARTMERYQNYLARMAELGVWTRRMLWRDFHRQFYASEYYNDLIVPNRAFDAMGAAIRVPGVELPAGLYFHHDRPTGRKFRQRGADLLRLLCPAFEAGVHAYLEFHERRETLLSGITARGTGESACLPAEGPFSNVLARPRAAARSFSRCASC